MIEGLPFGNVWGLAQAANPWVRAFGLQDHNTRIVVLATTLLGLAAGGIGVFTLLRRRALMGDALSHAMLPGIGLAFLVAPSLGLPEKSLPVLIGGAVISGLVAAAAILLIRWRTRLPEDAALGIVLSVFFGAGLVILSLVQQTSGGSAAGLESFIYGKTASITIRDAGWIAAAAVPTLILVGVLMKAWALVCFDEGFARTSGLSVGAVDIVMMAAVVLVIVTGLQAVGAILMIALLVIPAAAARFWTHRVDVMVVVAAVLGGVSCLFGSLLSAAAEDLPSGATIVLVAAVIFGFSMVLGSQRGLWWRLRAHRARRERTREVALAAQADMPLGQRSGGS
jgi:manganese/zinc/iron transport system permease protein